jgi:hypothetical protein
MTAATDREKDGRWKQEVGSSYLSAKKANLFRKSMQKWILYLA